MRLSYWGHPEHLQSLKTNREGLLGAYAGIGANFTS